MNSMVENNVALMICSFPAMTTLVKEKITGTAFFQSLSSKLWSSRGRSTNGYINSEEKKTHGTHDTRPFKSTGSVGSTSHNAESEYEFQQFTATKVSVGGVHNSQQGRRDIVRTYEVTQDVKQNSRV